MKRSRRVARLIQGTDSHSMAAMWQGAVVSIHITSAAGQPMETVPEARAVPGRGLEGDRYFAGTGYYSDKPGDG